MSIKVYIHFEVQGFPEKTSKLAIPKSWMSRPVQDIIGLFTKAYNDKNPENLINIDEFHLETEDGMKVYSNDITEVVLNDRVDYYLKMGSYIRQSSLTASLLDSNDKRVRCRNYGCNLYYLEEENGDDICQHHTGPPIFHDTMKCWSCCRDRKAYDFESFQLINGCSKGRHSIVVPDIAISKSPNSIDLPTPPTGSGTITTPPLKSIESYNAANPDAVSAASSAAKIVTTRKSSRLADGITARCQRKGCQKVFEMESNTSSACTYHKGQPIFHDAIKFWSCCPNIKCYDFDEFLVVPGCATGFHDDGVIELKDSE